MPELAEVAYYSRLWDAGLGKRVLRVHTHPRSRIYRQSPAAGFEAGLPGTEYREARTHGKNLLFGFSKGLWLGAHLGMTGELLTEAPDFQPGKHDHLVIFTKAAALVFRDPRMFGALRLDESPGKPPEWWTGLPPGIMDEGFTAAHVRAGLERHPKTPLKALLLDQALFPGIGNWMADEALWQLREHPALPAAKADAAELRKALRRIVKVSLQTIGKDWSDPPDTWLFRRRWRSGGACPRCGGELSRETLRGRTACWCPVCQERKPVA